MSEEEVDFPLTKGIKYASGGETIEGVFIKLLPPSTKQLRQCTALKQAFYQTVSFFEDKADTSEVKVTDNTALDGPAIISAMFLSNTVNMTEVLVQATDLFRTGVALMDGEVKLTKPMIDEMSPDDLEAMTGEYMANFILASLLKDLN